MSTKGNWEKRSCMEHANYKKIELIIKPLNLQGVYQLLAFANLLIYYE